MPELEWLALARADLLAIVDYISDDNPDAAQRVKDDIEAKVSKLMQIRRSHPTSKNSGQRPRLK